jgi:hypothetical protein
VVLLAGSRLTVSATPDVQSFEHAAVVWVVADDSQQLIFYPALMSQPAGAPLVLAVPGAATLDRPELAPALFAQLASETAGSSGTVPNASVDPNVRDAYNVAILSPGDQATVPDWLATHAPDLTPATADLLQRYAADGWSVVALQLEQAMPGGELAPLRLRYDSERRVFPLPLIAAGTSVLALDMYVLAEHRVAADPATVLFADQVEQLDPMLQEGLATVGAEQLYLTRLSLDLQDPVATTDDLQLVRAPSDTPVAPSASDEADAASSARLLLWLAIVAAASFLALPIGFFFKRRFDAISPDRSRR